jgi:hypothetical protein
MKEYGGVDPWIHLYIYYSRCHEPTLFPPVYRGVRITCPTFKIQSHKHFLLQSSPDRIMYVVYRIWQNLLDSGDVFTWI